MARSSIRVLPIALIALASVLQSRADSIDFSFYPESSRSCLYDAADASRCETGTVSATNSCLCRNGGNFVTNAAACLGRSARGDLETVYETMRQACEDSDTPLSITEQEFMSAADAATSTSSTTTPPSSSPTTPTESPPPDGDSEEQESTGLSTGALAGIITGASAAGLALIGALAYYLVRRRRRSGDESHPMLPHAAHGSLVPDMSAYYGGSPPGSGAWPPEKDWGRPPDVRSSGFNWESPAHLSYSYSAGLQDPRLPHPPPGAADPPAAAEPIQELDGTEHHPTGSAQAPAEMPAASPVVPSMQPTYMPLRPS